MNADTLPDDRRAAADLAALRLVPARPEHIPAYLSWRREATMRRFNPLSHAPDEEVAAHLLACGHDLADRTKDEYRWIVELRGYPIGSVGAKNISRSMRYAEIGYGIAEDYHGRGLGTRAVALLVDRLFGETDFYRLFALISVENIASLRLVERLGFVREGRLREHYEIQGRRVDEIFIGLLRHEWQPLAARS